MAIMLFDVETSDLPDFNKRARDPAQPHIVAAAAVRLNDNLEVIDDFYAIAKPDGWESSPQAFAAHGITTEFAMRNGEPEKQIAQSLFDWILTADTVAAYNQQFDKFLLRIAGRRFDIFDDTMDEKWKALPMVCCMKPFTDLCKLPKAKGNGYKYPKLQEAYRWAFGKEFAGAHNAMADLRATVELFIWLKNNGKV